MKLLEVDSCISKGTANSTYMLPSQGFLIAIIRDATRVSFSLLLMFSLWHNDSS